MTAKVSKKNSFSTLSYQVLWLGSGIRPPRTIPLGPIDLLFGCMVDWGVQLSLPMSTETVDGVKIYTVNEGDLVACFGSPITDNVVKAMADKAPLRVLFRDSCFEGKDERKINVYEQFKQLLGWNDKQAINNIRVI